ncbi:cytochrome c [Luteibacter sp. 22Crub2.1]|uniref:cytochrome c n=1 Tax=Luteibacter sp. 22Crub2.1 TaxID=1283288 RepID=UPI0009A66063|nr:cytochrome c [Luteibacter sp. 22Crub2.1]SKB62482.1 Cytochrome c, mono-and diheme variants [Luteibacter sp. 22Crub2.1]
MALTNRLIAFLALAFAAGVVPASDLVERGRYLTLAGDCASCHTTRGGAPFSGGRVIGTPFGAIPAPNLTPDRDTGLGAWSADDFYRAMHNGKGHDDRSFYPVFPFTSYTKVTRADTDAIFAYLKSLPPVKRASIEPMLRWPYSMRSLIASWRLLYFDEGEFVHDPKRSAAWNRGAYLVQGLGHCNECHANRNAFGAMVSEPYLAGGIIPVQNWYAPDLSMGPNGGLAGWSEADVVALLKTGRSAKGTAFGPMAEVVLQSTQHLTDDDLAAMATYLRSLPERDPPAQRESAANARDLARTGQKVYVEQCADCHGVDGHGKGDAYPPLDLNASVTEPTGINAIRMVLSGGFAPATRDNPRPYSMPPFSQKLSDDDAAAVVTYIRQAWSNKAASVSPNDVRAYKSTPGG